MLHLMQRLTQLKSYAHAGKILKRISAVALMRINDRVSRRQNIRRRVMIGNDDLQPCRGSSHLVYAADTAVNCHQKRRTCFGQSRQRFVVQSVAFIFSFGDIRVDLGAKPLQIQIQQ